MTCARTVNLAASLMLGAGCNAILGIEDLGGPGGDAIDASADAPPGPPMTPSLAAPRRGAATGSVHAPRSLRPRFVWRAVIGATRYELQVDDSCQTASFPSCLLPSPEVSETDLGETSFAVASDLPVSLSVPVGRRYFWRVRACNDHGCSDWSETWYLDVGRLADDVNGDGYGDIVVGMNAHADIATQVGTAYLVFGRQDLSTPPTLTTLPDPRSREDGRFGHAVAMVGDVNADGYGDVLVGAWNHDNNSHTGTTFLYRGRANWPVSISEADTNLERGFSQPDTAFGGAMTGRGDINGDGYADMAIASVPAVGYGFLSPEPTVPGYVRVAFGRATWAATQAGTDLLIPDVEGEVLGSYGVGLSLGDLDRDGLSDLVVGGFGSQLRGRAAVYFGQATYPASPHTITDASIDLPSAAQGFSGHGAASAICGDGLEAPVLVVGAPFESSPSVNSGVLRLFAGRDAWPDSVTTAERSIPEPTGAVSALMSATLRCGDVNGDGRDDVVVGGPGSDAGALLIYNDVVALPSSALTRLTGDSGGGRLGAGLAVTDFNGDGLADVFGGRPQVVGGGEVVGWLGRSTWPAADVEPDITIDNPTGIDQELFGRALD